MLLPSRSLTLKDIRIALSSAEHLSTLSKQFINERKTRKINDSMLINVMEKYEISENIANSICDAIIKAQELKFDVIHSEPEVLAHVEEVDDSFEPDLQEKFLVNKNGCTCKRFEHTGIPCKHYIRFLMEMKMDILDNIKVSDRWKIKNLDPLIEHLEPTKAVHVETSDKIAPQNRIERYRSLKSSCFSIMKIASISQEKFQIAKETMDSLEQKLTCPTKVIDDASSRPGRPSKSTNLVNWNAKDSKYHRLFKFVI